MSTHVVFPSGPCSCAHSKKIVIITEHYNLTKTSPNMIQGCQGSHTQTKKFNSDTRSCYIQHSPGQPSASNPYTWRHCQPQLTRYSNLEFLPTHVRTMGVLTWVTTANEGTVTSVQEHTPAVPTVQAIRYNHPLPSNPMHKTEFKL
jgi:hypothetical protein